MTNAFFAKYKQNRQNETARLQAELNKTANPKEAFKDATYWEPTVDKAGNGSAIIRFLPARDENSDAYVVELKHSFKGPTGLWYIENCRTMLGRDTPDPVMEFIEPLWTGDEADKKRASAMKRKVHFISNILVVEDEKNPANVGKVFKFKYGKKLFEKLNKMMNLTDTQIKMGKKPINPFDLFEGANMLLDVKKKDGFRNYDDSEFAAPGPVFDSEDKMAALFDQMHDLKAEVSEGKVKSYDVLQKHLYKVLGIAGAAGAAPAAAKPVTQTAKPATTAATIDEAGDGDDDGVDVDAIMADLK